jgi:hypothetical protein
MYDCILTDEQDKAESVSRNGALKECIEGSESKRLLKVAKLA